MFAPIDGNNFYVNCERVFAPWKGGRWWCCGHSTQPTPPSAKAELLSVSSHAGRPLHSQTRRLILYRLTGRLGSTDLSSKNQLTPSDLNAVNCAEKFCV
jgi:hypothetical protein